MGLLSDDPLWETFGLRALWRVASGGADFGECLTTVQRVGSGDRDGWYREWTATAERLAATGDDCAAGGHRVSAREAYLRAVTYFHISYLPLFGRPLDPRLAAASERETATFRKAAALLDPPVEVLEIPFEGKTLPAYLVMADRTGRPRPTMLHTNGYDSNVQEMYFLHAPAAVRRGYNCLLFDGPGQGRALIRHGLPLRPDWEHVVRPVVDYALARPEVDPHRLVLAGWSFGGFLAPRAAAFEPRLAALVADPGQWDQRDNLAALPLSPEDRAAFPHVDPARLAPLEAALQGPQADPELRWRLLQRGPMVHCVDTIFDALAALAEFELSPVAGQIACSTLLTMAEGDSSSAGASKLYEALRVSRKSLVRFTAAESAGGHCEPLGRTLYQQRAFDWLDETLRA
jgi:hypothetical protein